MLLKKLIKDIPKEKKKIKILGLTTNSKEVKKGYIFFAIKGLKFNGEKFINEAIKKGAAVIICSQNYRIKKHKSVFILKTTKVRYILSEIASKFYKRKPKNIIAVTGTNGKTSVADLFYQILSINKIPVASIGTLGIKFKRKIIKTDLTSPDTISLHKELEKIKKNNIDNVIIETSSHGLHQRRLDHINFKAGIFTNFSQDHLDYHKSMKSYFKAKLILFNRILTKKKIVISDKSIKEFMVLKKISKKRQLRLFDINLIRKKVMEAAKFRFREFQLKNLSMAIIAAKICKLKEKKIFKSLSKIKDTDGRLELVKTFAGNIKLFVDFAHTPDALSHVLKELKKTYGNNVSLVFGCGGNRDKKKRPLMASIASLNCKKVYVTDDNPRNEDPETIRKDIIKKIKTNNFLNIGNRAEAIKTAVLNAEANEVILVAGKGHEDKQIYKNKVLHTSDKEIIKKIKKKTKIITSKNQNFIQNKMIVKNITNRPKLDNFNGIAIDSRQVKKNNLFLTIKGKNHDGFKFITKAIKKGARYIVSSKINNKNKDKIIKVADEIKFLNDYAQKKREHSKAKIFAITGSAGKTSLKNLLKDLLQNFGKTYSSPKSYNNQFGVPLSLSNLETQHKYGVFEVGMSKKGEIFSLSKLIKPHVAVITNIGEAHIENFKNLRGIAETKGEIINNICKSGTIILNHDDKFLNYFQKKAKLKNLNIVTFGLNKKSNVYPIKMFKNKKNDVYKIKVIDQIIRLECKNINIYNLLSSLAILKILNLDLSKVSKHFKYFEPSEGRGKIHKIKRYKKIFKLIDESYNANPLSVKNAIKNFNSIKKKKFKKYFIFGDMLELGKKSDALHKNLSKVINNSDIDKVFVKGNKSLITYKNIKKNKRGNIFQQEEDIDFTLNSIIANNDYLMIKGSNATGLSELSKRIIKGF